MYNENNKNLKQSTSKLDLSVAVFYLPNKTALSAITVSRLLIIINLLIFTFSQKIIP